jgi:protein-disulfide isomerase
MRAEPHLFFLAALTAALSLAGCRGSDAAREGAQGTAQTAASSAATHRQAGASAADSVIARADSGRIQGNPDASIWVVEVSDFQCPYCRSWHEETFDALKREYIDPGKVRFAYVNFPLPNHKHARPAAEVAMCAGVQGKFWEVQHALFRTQAQWSSIEQPAALFDSLATAAGVDRARLKACTTSESIRSLIQADYDRAVESGITSTPSFLVAGVLLEGAQPIAEFRKVIEAALAKRGAEPAREEPRK